MSLEKQIVPNKGEALDKDFNSTLKKIGHAYFIPRWFKKKDEKFYATDECFINYILAAFETGGSIGINMGNFSDSKILAYFFLYLGIDGIYRLASLNPYAKRGPATPVIDLVSYPIYKILQRSKNKKTRAPQG